LPPPAQLLEMVAAAGFADVEHRRLGAGAAQLITGTRA
jgi:ubiquinone/menaquinone biosynthesis C-methylase UbiE